MITFPKLRESSFSSAQKRLHDWIARKAAAAEARPGFLSKTVPAGTGAGWLALPALWVPERAGSSPRQSSKPAGKRLGSKFNHSLRKLSPSYPFRGTKAQTLEKISETGSPLDEEIPNSIGNLYQAFERNPSSATRHCFRSLALTRIAHLFLFKVGDLRDLHHVTVPQGEAPRLNPAATPTLVSGWAVQPYRGFLNRVSGVRVSPGPPDFLFWFQEVRYGWLASCRTLKMGKCHKSVMVSCNFVWPLSAVSVIVTW